ncbi:MAG TPA: CoA ester lyase, partial [Chloroflexota bacterium]
ALYSHLIGVTPVDSVFSDVNDDEGLEKDTLLARQLGFRGKFLIHPRQAEIVTRVFTPSDREIEYAREVVKAFEEAEARGEASVALNGKMIDIPIVERARALLAAAQQVATSD